ncbi:MAG: hemagglutinin [Actinomycetaceae bacterium]|nr:hemagglutinin [Actinomycetaceae bacterium]MDU0970743.1 hemagglutinin [Actinomycetaceae bacterium]
MSFSTRPTGPEPPRRTSPAHKPADRHGRQSASVYRRRRLGCGGVLLAIVVLVVIVVKSLGGHQAAETSTEQPEPTTPPLSAEGWDPGTIITNAEMTDTSTMTEAQVQQFLDTWGKGCRPGGDGAIACLKDYQVDAATKPASASCPRPRERGQGLKASTIIWRTAQACGINPQVILVTLQKEQGLITASSSRLTQTRYDWAMGYGCPDGHDCDRQFAGFDTQVYQAAAQWKRYMNSPWSYSIIAGQVNHIPHSPDASCGAEDVMVTNRATAALYNYTPYVPTEDALNGYTEGCSADGVGNLRFYEYMKAWFR